METTHERLEPPDFNALSGTLMLTVYRDTGDDSGLEDEVQVEVTFDEGRVFSARRLDNGERIELTVRETADVEQCWAEAA